MAALCHPTVLAFYGLCLRPPLLISEYCAHGSVFDILQATRASPEMAQQASEAHGWLASCLCYSRGRQQLPCSGSCLLQGVVCATDD